jgi:1-acyl-sn-glycerol-3-phosphate acyltransferase
MIKAKKGKLSRLFWKIFIKTGIYWYFGDLKLLNMPKIDFSKPVLLLSNHFSWWDGFIAYRINDLFFKKSYHVMMIEKNLESNIFLRTAGAFSVNKSSRSLIESLQYSSELLSNPNNLLHIFPQGQIQALHEEHIFYGRGAEKLAERHGEKINILFMCVFFEYVAKPKPDIFIFFENFEAENPANMREAFFRFRSESQKKLFKIVEEMCAV